MKNLNRRLIKISERDGLRSQIPYLAKAYSLDDTTFYMGGSWLDIPNTLTDAYVFLRNSYKTIPSIKQACYISSTNSKVFSNFGSKVFIDPRFDQNNIQNLALDRNAQIFSDMKYRRVRNQVMAKTTQQPFPERITFATNSLTRSFRPKKVLRVKYRKLCQFHFMTIRPWSRNFDNSYSSFLQRPSKILRGFKHFLLNFDFYATRKGIQQWTRMFTRAQYWNRFRYINTLNLFKALSLTNTLTHTLRQYVLICKNSFDQILAPRKCLRGTRKKLAKFRYFKRRFIRAHKGLSFGGFEPFNKVQFRRFHRKSHSDLSLSWRLSHFNVKYKRIFYGLLQYFIKKSRKFFPLKKKKFFYFRGKESFIKVFYKKKKHFYGKRGGQRFYLNKKTGIISYQKRVPYYKKVGVNRRLKKHLKWINKNRGFFPQPRFFYLNKKKHYAFKRRQRFLQAQYKQKKNSKNVFKKYHKKQNIKFSKKSWIKLKSFTKFNQNFKHFSKKPQYKTT